MHLTVYLVFDLVVSLSIFIMKYPLGCPSINKCSQILWCGQMALLYCFSHSDSLVSLLIFPASFQLQL